MKKKSKELLNETKRILDEAPEWVLKAKEVAVEENLREWEQKAKGYAAQQDIIEKYKNILHYSQFVKTLNSFELEKILIYANFVHEKAETWIYKMVDLNPASKYNYPIEYLPGLEFFFWRKQEPRYLQSTTVIKKINDHLKLETSTDHKSTTKKQTGNRSFPEFLNCKDKETFADALKEVYKGKMKISYRYMLIVLKDLGLLDWDGHHHKDLYNAMKLFFGNKIGTQQNIFTTKFIESDRIDEIKNANRIISGLFWKN
ncbi:MAG: hypothetical protein ABSF81_18380 [Bacteroidales bacterium]